MSTDPIGDKFKRMEREWSKALEPNSFFVVRVDGKAFHTYTRELDRPFDLYLQLAMDETAITLANEIDGALIGYTQSDEISVIGQCSTEPWFGGTAQKIASVAASIATARFNEVFMHPNNKSALFDGRVHDLTDDYEADTYILWRKIDTIRNSVNMLAREYASHKQLHGVGHKERVELLKENGVYLSDIDQGFLYGRLILRQPEEYTAQWIGMDGQQEKKTVTRYNFKAIPANFTIVDLVSEQVKLREERRSNKAGT